MPGTYPGFRWGNKPPIGTPLDRGHHLAPGLAISLLFDEGGGEPFDAAGQRTFPASNPATWAVTDRGPARYATGGTSAVEIPQSVVGPLTSGGFTIRVLFRPRTWPGGYTALWDSASREISPFFGTSGSISFNLAPEVPWNLTAGSWWDIAITRTAAQWATGGRSLFYRNGAPLGYVNGISTSAIGSPLCFGRNSSGGGQSADADFAAIQMWPGRALTADEVAGLYADPYGLYLAPTTRRFFGLSSGTSPSTLSAAGSASTSFVGGSLASSALSSAGSASTSLVASALASSGLSAAGSASVSFASSALASAALSSSGSASVSFAGSALASASLASAGSASTSLVGGALTSSVLVSSGSASTSLVASALATSALSSAGSASTMLVGGALASSVLASSGSASVAFLGSTGGSTLAAAGSASVAFAGSSLSASTLSAAGSASVAFVGSTGASTLASAGSASVAFSGSALATAALSASGSASVAFVGSSASGGTSAFAMAGSAAVSFAGSALATSTLPVAGSASVAFAGSSTTVASRGGSGGTSARSVPLPVMVPTFTACVPLPDDLVDAMVARLQSSLVAAGQLTWAGDGRAPKGVQFPYCSIGEPDESDSYWTTQGDGLADGHLSFACYAATKKEARLAGDRVFAAIHDAPLEFLAGTLVYLRQDGRSASLDPDPAPGGGDCWQEARSIHYQYAFDPPPAPGGQ